MSDASLNLPSLIACSSALVVVWLLLRAWTRKSPLDNVPGPQEYKSFLEGNMSEIMDAAEGFEFNRRISEEYGGVVSLNGPIGTKVLYVFDPSALQRMAKKQSTYVSANWQRSGANLIFGRSLLAVDGEVHSKQRKLLNPVFTTENTNAMYPIFVQVADSLRRAIAAEVHDGARSIDVAHWLIRTNFEMMGQAGLGTSLDPIVRHPDKNLLEPFEAVVPAIYKLHAWVMLSPLVEKLGPPGFRRFVARWIPHSNFQALRRVVDTMWGNVQEIFLERKAAFMREGINASLLDNKDLISIILRDAMNGRTDDRVSDEELIAHVNTLLLAATDTTANLVTRTLQILSERKDMQAKLRSEILAAQSEHGKTIPVDVLLKLPYLEAVVKETLRLHPPGPLMNRISVSDDCLPLSQPMRGRDGTMINEVIVPKGTIIFVSLWAHNRNKAVWGEDASEWKPERWLSPLPESVLAAQIAGTYSQMVSFGIGKRHCIGFRVALITSRLILSRLVANFEFSPTGEEVFWHMAGVSYVTMSKSGGGEASLMLNVRALDAEQ